MKKKKERESSQKPSEKLKKVKGKFVPIHTMKDDRGSSIIASLILKLGARWR
jgi:hypothetical protein